MGSRCGMWKVPAPASKTHLGDSSLSLHEADGQGCPGTNPNHWSPSSWLSVLSCGASSLSSHVYFSVLHSYRICLSSCIFSVSLGSYLSVHLPVSVSLPLSLSSCHCRPYSVSCSQTVSDSMSVLHLWLSLLPSSWLLTKGQCPYPPCLDKSANQREPLG